jgi:hypothetical protein
MTASRTKVQFSKLFGEIEDVAWRKEKTARGVKMKAEWSMGEGSKA